MDHSQTIQTLSDALCDTPGIHGLFLSGSHATGQADAYSDIDFVLVAEDGATDAVAEIWRTALARTGEIILWWDRTGVPVLINAITIDWTRTDVVILKPGQLAAQTQDKLKPLFDHSDLYAGLAPTASAATPDPAKLTRQIEEVIRIIGLLHLVDGRAEYNNGVLGVFHLRNQLVDLLIAETAVPLRGGILHLNRLITPEQQGLLTSLPAPAATRESVITCHLAYAAAFLPRAKRRAAALGAKWPTEFEDVTWQMLHDTLNITRPYNHD